MPDVEASPSAGGSSDNEGPCKDHGMLDDEEFKALGRYESLLASWQSRS
jgi:hypothetical protein